MSNLITASIVTYKNDIDEILDLCTSIFNYYSNISIYIINNDCDVKYDRVDFDSRIYYIQNKNNIGFGAAHNIALKESLRLGSSFHFIINPDVILRENVITKMIKSMNDDKTIGLMMPNILNEDGTIQYLPKLLPNPLSIILRKINPILPLFDSYMNKYELRGGAMNEIQDVAIVSGCFSLLSREAIEKVGMYDEKYFLYFEDWDLSRRIAMNYRTVVYNSVSIIHKYNSGANKNSRLFIIFIQSALIYFFKWGFFFDSERIIINKKILKKIYNG
jgi:GT2 family glycosyltransferase